MSENLKKRVIVREHPRRVGISPKNPSGITIVDRHPRRLPGTYLDPAGIKSTFKSYDRRGVPMPTAERLEFRNSDKYDDLIGIWTDYFNKTLKIVPPLDPDVLKALIASESSFDPDPKNKLAFGITQITPKTLKILQDAEGEAKSFIFTKIRQKDLKDPDIAIPLAARWLSRKKNLAADKLGHAPTADEIILEYKGLLFSKSKYKTKALESFRKSYEKLKKK